MLFGRMNFLPIFLVIPAIETVVGEINFLVNGHILSFLGMFLAKVTNSYVGHIPILDIIFGNVYRVWRILAEAFQDK